MKIMVDEVILFSTKKKSGHFMDTCGRLMCNEVQYKVLSEEDCFCVHILIADSNAVFSIPFSWNNISLQF